MPLALLHPFPIVFSLCVHVVLTKQSKITFEKKKSTGDLDEFSIIILTWDQIVMITTTRLQPSLFTYEAIKLYDTIQSEWERVNK